MPGAEALQHLQGGSGGAGPINIASADLRRPSNVSAASMPGLESVGGMFGSVDSNVPPLLCKFSCVCLRVLLTQLGHHTHSHSYSSSCLLLSDHTSHLPTLGLPWLTQPHLPPQIYPPPPDQPAESLSVIFTCKCQAHSYTDHNTIFCPRDPFPNAHKLTPKQSRGLASAQTRTPARSPGTPCNSLATA